MSSKNLHIGHRERLRNRFLETGTAGFQDHEILELVLFYALPRVNTNEIAHRLIKRFGSISAVLDADISELSSVKGISESSALLIKYMKDLCRSYAFSSHHSVSFSSSDELAMYIADYFRSSSSETSIILSLNTQLELSLTLSFPAEELLPEFMSSRRLAEIALRNGFRRIAVGRNSPDKPPVPTENDYRTARLITETLTPLGVEICDYIICGCSRTFSMRKNGAFSFTSEVLSSR